jgi:hypothetical protein
MANACIDEKSKGEMDEFGEHSPNSTEQLLDAADLLRASPSFVFQRLWFVIPRHVVRVGLPSRRMG